MNPEARKKRKNAALCFGAAGGLLLLAAVFKFVFAGYSFAALFFLLLALAAAVYGAAARLFDKKPKASRRLSWTMTIVICVGAALLIAVEIPIVSASFGDGEQEADYLIVLGAGVDGREPSVSLRDRLEAALAYLQRYPEACCVLSGGKGDGEEISEAACMYAWLTERGIDPARLLLEENSTNTEENLVFSQKLLPEGAKAALVTSEYHLYRAQYLGRQLGLETIGVPAKTSLPFLKLTYFFREAFAVVRLWLFS